MRRQGNGGDLRAVAPLSQEGQHECFKEDRSAKPGPRSGGGAGGGDGGGGVFFCGRNILAFVWVGLVNVRGRKHAG